MDEPYKYRNRPLNQQAMQELILKLYEGKTRTRAEIIEGLEREHRRLGGTATKDLSNRGRLTGAFKGAAAGLRKRGAMKDAGYKYWHVIGNPSTPTPGQPPPDERTGGRDSISKGAFHEHMKLALYAQQNGRCAQCNRPFPKAVDFDLDHIVPRAHGGDDKPGNLQLLCRPCNTGKGAGR